MCKKTSEPDLQNRAVILRLWRTVLLIPVRLVLLFLRVYQWVFSPLKQFFFGPLCGCRFQPTCSCYAYDAFSHFGLWKGFWFTLRRLLRCHPWHPGGFDPLPDNNYSK